MYGNFTAVLHTSLIRKPVTWLLFADFSSFWALLPSNLAGVGGFGGAGPQPSGWSLTSFLGGWVWGGSELQSLERGRRS